MFFFETIKVIDNKAYNLPFHQKRVDATAKHFGFFPVELSDINIKGKGLNRLKLIYSKNGIKEYKLYPYVKKSIKSVKIVYSNIKYDYKYLNRDVLNILKQKCCDEVFIVKDGLVTDSIIANLAFFNADEWLTPKTPLLKGTTRQRLLDEGFLKEADIDVSMLKNFKSYAFLNAMVGFYEVKDLKIIDEDKDVL